MKKLIIALFPLIALTAKAQEESGEESVVETTVESQTTSAPPAAKKEKKQKTVSSSQSSGKPMSISKKKLLAAQLWKEGSYYNAVEYYEEVLKLKPDDLEVVHALAELNRLLRDYKAAETYYELELKKNPDKWPNSRFFLAQMKKMNGKYAEARKEFRAYQKIELDKNEKSYKSLAKNEIRGCDSVSLWQQNPYKIKVQHENGVINNIQTDYAPHPLSGGRLLYSSLKSDTAIRVTDNESDYYSKLYIATRENGEWTSDVKLDYPPNDAKTHIGNGVFTPDEKLLYYTKCSSVETKKEDNVSKMRCALFRITKNGNSWGAPEELTTLNHPEATTTQPALGVDKSGKDVLYFVSDRSGRGGLDIFYAEIQPGGSFGAVKNAGSEINTTGDEWSPYYDAKNKTMYFSSTGHPGMGGLDIFGIKGTPGAWGVPYNLGGPVNSAADDMYYILNETGKKGFLVSNRVGTKTLRGETSGDDIWSVAVNEEMFLKAFFVERKDEAKTPIDGIEASLYKVDGENFDFVSSETTSNGEPVLYTVKRGENFKINGNKDGYWPSVENIAVAEDQDGDTLEVYFLVDRIEKIKIKVENIYFEFNKAVVLDYYQLKLDSVFGVLMQYPGYSVEVQGHTDSKGSDEYNQKLSQKRAEEARGYLIGKGIESSRVIAVGYGESSPIAPNEMNGEDDPEGRARNRRVEFKILPDRPEEAPSIEYEPGEPIIDVKTGPGFDR